MLLGGNTQNATSSYGKHYELTSDRRKIEAQSGSHTTSNIQARRAKHTANDSEDSLVTGGESIEVPSGAMSFSNDKNGINVKTTIAMHYGERSNNREPSSPV